MSTHDGHRQRLRNRYRDEGLDHFDDIHALELMLCYALPRVDTNPLAHRLMDHFGSIDHVLEASPEELEQVEGVGKQVSTYLSLFVPVSRLHRKRKTTRASTLDTIDKCGQYLGYMFLGRREEMACLLCMDAKYKVLCMKELSRGTVDSVNISTRKVVEVATQSKASVVVLAHNHPAGLLIPSREDHITTQTLLRALEYIGVQLADHLIFNDLDFISVKEAAITSPEFCYWS